MFRCKNGCGRAVGRGEPLAGDVLFCVKCATAINADLGYPAYWVDAEAIYRQLARPDSYDACWLVPLPQSHDVCGLVPLPPPRRRRFWGRWWR